MQDAKYLEINGIAYNVGYSSNDYNDSEKSKVEDLANYKSISQNKIELLENLIGGTSVKFYQGGIDAEGNEDSSDYWVRSVMLSNFELLVNSGYNIAYIAIYNLDGSFRNRLSVGANPLIAEDPNSFYKVVIFKGNQPDKNIIRPSENIVADFKSGIYKTFDTIIEGDVDNEKSARHAAQQVTTSIISKLPNEEDLTIELDGKTQVMKFANRSAEIKNDKVSSLGYVVLRRNKSFAEQVTEPNCIYEVRYEYSIDSAFSMPKNCSLKFNGGRIIINAKFGFNNVELSDNANILYIGENGSLSGTVKTPIKLSQVGAIGTGDVEYNRRALQALVDAGVKIIVDNSATFSDAIRIKTKINIEELINKDTTLSFPNSKGFVWDASADSEYSPNNYVKGFTITSKDNCFDFYNEGGNRFRNVHQSSFIDLDCISSEGYCFFAGNGKGSNGDQLTFGNNWKNILIKAPLKSGFYGFDGIEDEFSDVRGSDCAIAHFENCSGRFVRCQGSFGNETTPHFLKASGTSTTQLRLRCTFEMCNFENYINSVISAYSQYVYMHLSFNGCSFSPKGSETIDYHLIDTYYLYNLVWQNTRVVKENFATGKGHISNYRITNCQFVNDKDLYVYNAETKRRITVYAGATTEMCYTTNSDWGAKYYKKHKGLLVDELFITDTKVKGKTLDVVNNSSLNLFGAEKFYLKASDDSEGANIAINNFTFGTISGDDNILKRIVLQNTSKNATITIYHGLTGYGNIIISESGKSVVLHPKQFVECEIIGNAGGNTNIGNGIADGKDIILYIKSQVNNFRKIGSSEQKPTGIDTGFKYFNSELNKEEIWNGEEWVDNNADRKANTTETSKPMGLGYKTLSPNKSFAEQVTEANTIYEIRYTFDLGSATVSLKEGCTLKFNGGKLTNFKNLTLSNTIIEAQREHIFEVGEMLNKGVIDATEPSENCNGEFESSITGTLKNNKIYPEWFGAKADEVNDDSDAIQYALNTAYNVGGEVEFNSSAIKRYKVDNTIYLPPNSKMTSKNRPPKIYAEHSGSDNKAEIYFSCRYLFRTKKNKSTDAESTRLTNEICVVMDSIKICGRLSRPKVTIDGTVANGYEDEITIYGDPYWVRKTYVFYGTKLKRTIITNVTAIYIGTFIYGSLWYLSQISNNYISFSRAFILGQKSDDNNSSSILNNGVSGLTTPLYELGYDTTITYPNGKSYTGYDEEIPTLKDVGGVIDSRITHNYLSGNGMYRPICFYEAQLGMCGINNNYIDFCFSVFYNKSTVGTRCITICDNIIDFCLMFYLHSCIGILVTENQIHKMSHELAINTYIRGHFDEDTTNFNLFDKEVLKYKASFIVCNLCRKVDVINNTFYDTDALNNQGGNPYWESVHIKNNFYYNTPNDVVCHKGPDDAYQGLKSCSDLHFDCFDKVLVADDYISPSAQPIRSYDELEYGNRLRMNTSYPSDIIDCEYNAKYQYINGELTVFNGKLNNSNIAMIRPKSRGIIYNPETKVWGYADRPTTDSAYPYMPNGIRARKGVGDTRPNTNGFNDDDIGFMFFDKSIGKPVWWDGSKWVDYTGTEA